MPLKKLAAVAVACLVLTLGLRGVLAASVAKHAPQDTSSTPTTNIKAAAIGVQMRFTDPQTGKLLWTADVDRIEALSPTNPNEVYGTLHNVRGILFQGGVAADHITAPIVNVDNATKVVVATGGVHVVSITQPGTSLTCDMVTYYAGTGHIIGQGNVVFHKSGFMQTSSSFAGDVKLKSVVMPAPGIGSGHGAVTTQLKL